MKNFFFGVFIVLFLPFSVFSDEGMWLPQLLHAINQDDMQHAGLTLSAEDLYNVNSSSIKDAIVSLGGFCTAEMISSEGLMLTNHHCAFDNIQEHSSLKNDYLTDGFWAMDKESELANEGLSASFIIFIKDVSDRILSTINSEMSETERLKKIKETSKKIIEEITDTSHYNARVKSFFNGNEFYLIVYETFKDIRLVGAPPSAIGKFGGDTDNWMWPRHTGDFALYRIYCDTNGLPNEYSPSNVPYKPKHHFPIQLDGVYNNDFTMIYGFPGSTDRYLTSYGIKEALKESNPTIVSIREKKLSIIKEGMNSNPNIKIKYAAKYAQTSNYWKYYIGQSKGLKRMRVYEKRLALENSFLSWIGKNEERKEKYGSALKLIEESYKENAEINLSRIYLNEAVFMGAEILYFSFMMHNKINSLPKENPERNNALVEIKSISNEFYKNYDANIDQGLLASMLKMYYDNIEKSNHPSIFKTLEKKSKNNIIKRFIYKIDELDFKYYSKSVFKKSIFSNKEKFLAFLKDPNPEIINQDPAYKTLSSIYDFYIDTFYAKRSIVREKKKTGSRLFLAGLMEMYPEKKWYPDANSTLRLSYGNVNDYVPGDAMHYDYYTTIEGIIEKEDSTNEEFIVPKKLKELYYLSDYGNYADTNGVLRINFISNNDITGGNSGSPVINAWGELVGTAFDGNWEAMSGDIAFENSVQRTISVDIRYIMFVIDKFAGATHLINEMTLAPSRLKNKLKN